jgi:hypothetical protein
MRERFVNRWLHLLRREALCGQEVLDDTTDPSAA